MTSIFSVQLGNGRIYTTLENLTQSVAGCRIMMLSELCLQTYPDSDLLPGAQPTLSTLQRVLSSFLSLQPAMAPKHLVLHALFWLPNRSPAGHRHSYSVQRPHLKDSLPLHSICAPLCLDSETKGIPILAHSLFPFLLISDTYWPLLILTVASASIYKTPAA